MTPEQFNQKIERILKNFLQLSYEEKQEFIEIISNSISDFKLGESKQFCSNFINFFKEVAEQEKGEN
jgi:hypothetical protein